MIGPAAAQIVETSWSGFFARDLDWDTGFEGLLDARRRSGLGRTNAVSRDACLGKAAWHSGPGTTGVYIGRIVGLDILQRLIECLWLSQGAI